MYVHIYVYNVSVHKYTYGCGLKLCLDCFAVIRTVWTGGLDSISFWNQSMHPSIHLWSLTVQFDSELYIYTARPWGLRTRNERPDKPRRNDDGDGDGDGDDDDDDDDYDFDIFLKPF